jgi:uncharacterized protein (TIGR03437 family)
MNLFPRLLRLAVLLAAFAVAANAGTSLLSLNPSYIQAGGPDVTLTIGGSGFVPGGVVIFGYAGTSLSTTYIDSTRISAVIPASVSALSGAYQLFVRNPDGSASSTLYFDIQPVLTSVTPNSAPAGSPTTPVTITGIGFVNGISLEFVTASGSTPIDSGYVSSTKMTAVIGASLLTGPGVATIKVYDADHPVSTTLQFTITASAPSQATLSSINPASTAAGGSGTAVQVIGSNFANGCTAQWNGAAVPTTLFNASQLSVQIPAALTALPGSASITVVNPGAAASNALTFTVTPVTPLLRFLNPSSAVAGGPAFTLTVSSGSLNPILSSAVVQWNGTPLTTTYVSSSQLTAQVPASLIASPGTANITIVNPGANPSNAVAFTIVTASPPALTSLSPSSATAGSAAFTLAVSGSNFTSGAIVQWNGTSLASNIVSSTQLTAQVPANLLLLSGTVLITVVEPGLPVSNALNFSINPATVANLASISPSSVTAGSPGFTLVATGSGFVSGSVIEWNGGPIGTTFVSSTQLTGQVPAGLVGTAGTAVVQVANPSASLSNSLVFTISARSATISSLSPISVVSGGPAFTLTVNGSGFVPASQVQWNGTAVSTTFVSAVQLTALVPAQPVPATVPITVVNPGNAPSTALTFNVTPPATPTISNIAPATATARGPAFTLTVTGSNFVAASIVTWNGVGLPTTFISSTQLTAQVAASWVAAPGSASISVYNASGVNYAPPATFTILNTAAPTLTSLSPASVVADGLAFSLTVNGSGFVSGAIVQWSGSTLATTFVSATQLTAQVPGPNTAAAGSADITVLNPASTASNALTLTVSAPSPNRPVVQSVLNAASYTRALAPGTWATIFGTQLAVTAASAPTVPLPLTLAEVRSVTVSGVSAPLSYVSPGQINFVVPFEAALGASVPVLVTTSDGGASAPVNITLVRTAPALFTQNAQGTGMAVAFNANFQPVTSVGTGAIILYGVGLGPTNPPPASSTQGGASAEPLNRVADQVQVFIGEVPCQVQFAGLAPGFPGIYQLNVIPPAAPASNRLYIVENGVTSNITTLPTQGGTNVTNVQGSIDGLYPASGTYAARNGNTPTSGPVSFSEMLNAGAATVSFDIRPNAQPFTVTAVGPGATAILQIDPAGGTWQGYVTSPTPLAKAGDFSLYSIVVYDLLTGAPFAGSIIPLRPDRYPGRQPVAATECLPDNAVAQRDIRLCQPAAEAERALLDRQRSGIRRPQQPLFRRFLEHRSTAALDPDRGVSTLRGWHAPRHEGRLVSGPITKIRASAKTPPRGRSPTKSPLTPHSQV